MDALVALGTAALKTRKPFMFNISAPFLVDYFWDSMMKVIPFTEFLFCNETEAQTVAKKMGWPLENFNEIAKRMAALPQISGARPRTAVITHGAESTVVCTAGSAPISYTPIKCPRESIVDTNGAGDSFVGGFISQLLKNAPINKCVDAGHYCAWKCLHEVGCRFSGRPDFN